MMIKNTFVVYIGYFSIIFIISLVSFEESPAFQVRADSLHTTAVRCARDGDFERAFQLIKEALIETDNSPEIVSDYVVILAWAEQYREAIKNYNALPDTYTPPGYVIKQVAKSYRSIGEFDTAIDVYKKYLEDNGDDRDAVSGLIYTYLDNGQFDAARQYINERMEKSPEDEWLQIFLADIFLREEKFNDAEAVYRSVIVKDPENTRAQLGISKILITQKKYTEADSLLVLVLEKDPKNIEALYSKGEALEGQGDYLAAYEIYEKFLSFYPNTQAALNLKYRALINLGNYSLAREKLEQSQDRIDPEIFQTLLGNEAMVYIWWEEPEQALKILDRNMEYVTVDSAGKFTTAEHARNFLLRVYYDKIDVLKRKWDIEGIIQVYEKLKNMDAEIPAWVLMNIADTYLYMQQPKKALALFREALDKQWNNKTRLMIYYTLMELERFDEAYELLEALDKDSPVQIIDRGILKDNWQKAEITFNRGWWLLYQDRLSEGQKYFENIITRAPFNSHIRTALAHTYMWRGLPRLALEEFEIVRITEPEDISGEIGYYYALYENDRGDEAIRQAAELLKKHPNNKHIQNLNRYIDIEKKHEISYDAGSIREDTGVESVYWSAKIEKPLAPWRKLFVEFIWRDIAQNELKDYLRRGVFGVDWRLNRDWWVTGAVSTDEDGSNFGYSGQIAFNPNDYLSFTGFYNHYSTTVPLRAKVRGVEAKEFRLAARYRQSENFINEAGISLYRISDGNDQWSYTFRLDKAITTRYSWKTRLSFDGYAGSNSRTDVPYFCPENIYSAYLTPMVEHVWYRRYEKSFVDRIYFGLGIQKQKEFSAQDVWYIRYEQDHQLSDILAFSIGAAFAQRNYDGEDTDVWSFFIKFNKKF